MAEASIQQGAFGFCTLDLGKVIGCLPAVLQLPIANMLAQRCPYGHSHVNGSN